jgi:hypothetical protein
LPSPTCVLSLTFCLCSCCLFSSSSSISATRLLTWEMHSSRYLQQGHHTGNVSVVLTWGQGGLGWLTTMVVDSMAYAMA